MVHGLWSDAFLLKRRSDQIYEANVHSLSAKEDNAMQLLEGSRNANFYLLEVKVKTSTEENLSTFGFVNYNDRLIKLMMFDWVDRYGS